MSSWHSSLWLLYSDNIDILSFLWTWHYLSLATPSSRWLISLLSVTQALSHFSHHGLSHLHNKTSVTTPIKINISHTHIHTHIRLHSSPCTLLSIYDIYYYLMPFSLLVYLYLSPSLEYKLHKIGDKLVPCWIPKTENRILHTWTALQLLKEVSRYFTNTKWLEVPKILFPLASVPLEHAIHSFCSPWLSKQFQHSL